MAGVITLLTLLIVATLFFVPDATVVLANASSNVVVTFAGVAGVAVVVAFGVAVGVTVLSIAGSPENRKGCAK